MPPFARDAVRHLLRGRSSSVAATLVLAMGIGAGAAGFALLDRALLQRLPYRHADRLAQVWATDQRQGILEESLSFDEYSVIASRARAFDKVAFYSFWSPIAAVNDHRSQIRVARVSNNLFDVLGVTPVVGTALPSGSESFIVLSHSLATRLFSTADRLPEHVVLLNGTPYTPIGIMPRGISFPSETDAWVPATRAITSRPVRDGFILGRLASGVALKQARSELDDVNAHLADASSAWTPERGLRAVALQQQVGSTVRDVVVLLFVAVILFFMIACASAGQLLYVENLRRRREWAVRTSLGASRRTIVAQLTLESALTALVATAAGVLVARWLIGISKTLIPPGVPRLPAVIMDQRVLWFMIGLGAVSALGVALVSAGRVLRGDLVEGLKDAPADTGGARTLSRNALLSAGTAVLVVLTVGAVSLTSALWRLTRADLGFTPSGVFTSRACAPPAGSAVNAPSFLSVLDRVREVPAFRSVALSDQLPIGGDVTYEIFVEGVQGYPEVRVQSVSGSYFRTLGIPLLEGSTFDDATAGNVQARRIAIVNRAFRDRFWPGVSPVGQRFMAALGDEPEWITVVGMAGNVRRSPSGDASKPQIFFSFFQQTHACGSLILKTDRPVTANVVRTVLWRTVDHYSLSDISTLNALLHGQTWQPRLRAAVTGGFAALALMFGAAALYATLTQFVSMRRKDLAVRAALGARRGDLTRVVLGTHAGPIGAGFLVGAVGSFVLLEGVSASVYGFEPLDVTSTVVVVLVLALAALAATAIPAWRAEQIDVLPALRSS